MEFASDLPVLLAGAFFAAFVVGAVGFADALILNAIWLHILVPAEAVPLIVACGALNHIGPIYRLRQNLVFDRALPFLVGGIFGIPLGAWALSHVEPDPFRLLVGGLLTANGAWMLLRPHTSLADWGGKTADGFVGWIGGFLGGFAGISGVLPAIWAGMRGWSRERQRGAFQPYMFVINVLCVIWFAASGLVTVQTLERLAWCIPVIVVGMWLGIRIYHKLDEKLFRRSIQILILVSGIMLLVS